MTTVFLPLPPLSTQPRREKANKLLPPCIDRRAIKGEAVWARAGSDNPGK